MAKLATLADLRQKVRDRGEWRSSYVPDAQLDDWLNQAAWKFYAMLSALDPLRYQRSSILSVASGTRSYQLPADFFRLVGVAVENDAQDGYIVLDSFSWDERYDTDYASTKAGTRFLVRGGYDTTDGYSHQGNQQIVLQPVPTYSANLKIDYIPACPTLSADNDAIDLISGVGEEWVICDAAVRCAAKEETDPSVWLQGRADAEKVLQAVAQQKDALLQRTKTVVASNSLQGLLRTIRARTGIQRDDVTDAELTEQINSSQAALLDILAGADQSHFLTRTDLSVSSGDKSAALPSDFYKAVQVAAADNTGADGYTVLETFRWEEQYDSNSVADAYSMRWRVRGSSLFLQPASPSNIRLRLDYVALPTALSAPSDTLSFNNNSWQEFIILDCCSKVAVTSERNAAPFQAARQEILQRISAMAQREISEERSTAASGTLEALRRAVRNRGMWKRDDISDAMLTEWINSGQASLFDLVVAADMDHFLTRTDLSVSAGDVSVSLPSGFYKAVQVAARDDATVLDGYTVLETFRWEESYDSNAVADAYSMRWNVKGSSLHLQPAAPGAVVLRLDYVAVPTALAAPDDAISFTNNTWQEYVILDACVKAATAAGTDPAPWAAQRQEVAQRIQASALRDVSERRSTISDSSLEALRRAVRARGDWPRDRLSDATLTEWINVAVAALFDLVVEADDTHFLSRTDLSVSAGDAAVALPGDFYKAFQVAARDDATAADGYVVLETFRWEELYDDNSVADAYSMRWRVRGSSLFLQPASPQDVVLRLDYIAKPTALSAPSDTISFDDNTWREFVILDAAAKAAAAYGTDPSVFMAQRQEVAARIAVSAVREMTERRSTLGSSTLEGLRRAVRSRGTWPRDAVSDADLTERINSSAAALYDLLLRHEPANFLSRSDISVVSGTREYSLPSDFYKLLGVAVRDPDTSDGYSVLERYMWDERYDWEIVQEPRGARYLVRGGNIQFHPTPSWTQTVRIEYAPLMTLLSAPSDTLSFRENEWQEWVILDAAEKTAVALGGNPAPYMQRKTEIEARIVKMSDIDTAKPKTVVDVTGRWRSRWRRSGFFPPR